MDRRFRAILDTAEDMAFVTAAAADDGHRITSVSRAGERIFAAPAAALVGAPVLSLFPENDHANVRRILDAMRGGGMPYRGEADMVRRDGRRFRAMLRSCALPAENGEPGEVVAVVTDLSERLHLLAMQHVVLGTSRDLAMLLAPDSTVLAANPAAARDVGLTVAELIGQRMADHYPPDVAARRLAVIRRVVRGGKPLRYTDEHDGRVFDALITPVPNVDGRVDRVAIHVRDVTAERQLQREVLAATNRDRQRTGRDLHDSLGQQLTGIGFLISTLASRLAERDAPLGREADAIARLVREAILQVRRISRGLCPVDLQDGALPAALAQLAQDAASVFKVRCVFRASGKAPANLPPGVALELYWIAHEAVHNAVRHAAPKRIAITLSAARGRGHLVVRNDGAPFPREAAERERGLGLRLMHYRAELIRAELTIGREPRGGTVVRCDFPLADGP